MFRAYRCVRRRRTPTREREPFVNVSQYLEIRRCYNRMRRETPSSSRITFDEFAILCILHQRKGLSSTQLAAEQGVSCPTMTHRGNHLAQLGYMTRSSSDSDRRRLRCALTRKGTSYVNRTVQRIAQAADPGSGLAELEPSEVVSLVTKMGSRPMSADELTLLCFAHADTRSMPIVRIVEATRHDENIAIGSSMRGALALTRCARIWAASDGRGYVVPDDVKDLAVAVLSHRIKLTAEATFAGLTTDEAISRMLETVPAPSLGA